MPRRKHPSPPTPETIELGRRVRERRLALGLTQEALAERADLHRTYISPIEGGQRNIAFLNLVRLASALEMDAGELVGGIDPA